MWCDRLRASVMQLTAQDGLSQAKESVALGRSMGRASGSNFLVLSVGFDSGCQFSGKIE